MKKFMSLLFSVVFVGSMMVVMGCAPKQEATQEAPAVEQTVPGSMENSPAAEATPAEAPAADQEAAPAE